MLPTPRTARHLALAAVVLIAAVACGSDEDGGGSGGEVSVEEFCAEVEALEAESDTEEDLTEADVEQLRDLATRAPADIQDDLEVMGDLMQQLLEVPEDDFETFFEIALSPEFTAASEALDDFAVNECGLESTAEGDGFEEVESDEGAEGASTEVEPVDLGPGTDELSTFIDTEYAGEAWPDAIFGTYLTNGEWTLDSSDWEGGELAACEGLARFLAENDLDATIRIRVVDFDEGTAEDLYAGPASSACAG